MLVEKKVEYWDHVAAAMKEILMVILMAVQLAAY
jgi:hypothetical protein